MTENEHPKSGKRHASFLKDENGTAMLEFILVAPLLCYLIVFILLIRHHIDYAQDSVSRYNELTFQAIHPANARSASGEASDSGGFGAIGLVGYAFGGIDIRTAVLAAGVLGLDASVGGILAGERYYNGFLDFGTPYDTLDLARSNYLTDYESVADMPDCPWTNIFGNLGTYFGNRIGGGTRVAPEGLSIGWRERFPLITDPWQRDYSDDLDGYNFGLLGLPLAGVILEALNVMTVFRTGPLPRFDNRDEDIGASEFVWNGGTCDELKLEDKSGKSTVWKIVK